MGIICKTVKQADKLYAAINHLSDKICLLTEESVAFVNGVVITTAHMAKGLEFDEVIVPFVTDKDYRTEIDRSMLYVACTRAMHKLYISASGNISTFSIISKNIIHCRNGMKSIPTVDEQVCKRVFLRKECVAL